MKIYLINPPGFSAFSPPLGILSLASYLKDRDIDVKINDASINALHYILEPHRFQIRIERSRQILQTRAGILPPNILHNLHTINKNMDELLNVLDGTWRKDEFYLLSNSFEYTIDVLNKLLIFSSLSYLPSIFGICTCRGSAGMVTSNHHNPFSDYYTDELFPEIERFAPDLIGVSISFENQFYFACTIIDKLVQKKIAPIVAGGSYFSIICDYLFKGSTAEISTDSTFLKRFGMLIQPYGICGEGEETLANLCNEHSTETKYDIPGLLYCDENQNKLKYTEKKSLVDTENLPVVTLEGVPIGKKYLSPARIAPLLTSRGCYWNKCTFCDHASVLDSKWRELEVQKVMSNLVHYKKKHKIDIVLFCDEAMSPRFLRELSESILEKKIQISFGTMIRFEKTLEKELLLASRAGCTFLSFGMESGSPEIIKKMRKGYCHNNAQSILNECARFNILVETHVMFGFPTESTDDAYQTISFLEKNKNNIAMIRVNPWILSPGCFIFRNPDTYGVNLNSLGYQLMNPQSYTIQEGINHDEALGFVNKLINHPVLGKKVLTYDLFKGYSEDYQLVRHICDLSRSEPLHS